MSDPAHEERTDRALEEATALIVDVRDDLPRAWRTLDRLAEEGLLPAVVMVLAAMVPDDRPVAEMIAWTDPEPPRRAYFQERYDRQREEAGKPPATR